MRRTATLITIAAAAALFLEPTESIAQAWSSVTIDRQPPVTGNGQIVTQARPIGNFRQIEARGASEVIVRVGPAPSLRITADSNPIPLIGSEIRGSKLILDARGSYRTRAKVRIVVTVPAIDAMALNGSGNGTVDGVASGRLALAIGGSGNLRATGRTRDLAIAIDGSGNVDARGLSSSSAAVVVSGSGNAEVSVNGPLSTVINGSGTVRYRGRAAPVSTNNNGSGRTVKVG